MEPLNFGLFGFNTCIYMLERIYLLAKGNIYTSIQTTNQGFKNSP